jgi:hypothetical protein
MKKIIFLSAFVVFLTTSIYSQSYTLGQIKTRKGTLDITYIRDVGRDYIKLYCKEETTSVTLSIPTDLKNIRGYIVKYHEWYKIAVDNKSVLNKTIGSLSTFKTDFQTNNGNYEIVFVESRTGILVAAFTPEQIDTFKGIISDENIDKMLNEEKRKKEKEDQLFQ